jgi:hypothetical protein
MNKPCQITSVSVRKVGGQPGVWSVRTSGKAGANTLHVTERGTDLDELLLDLEDKFTGAAVVKGLVKDV